VCYIVLYCVILCYCNCNIVIVIAMVIVIVIVIFLVFVIIIIIIIIRQPIIQLNCGKIPHHLNELLLGFSFFRIN